MRELVVVMPVYNEAECIAGVVRSWLAMLRARGVDSTVLVIDDGSRDATSERLSEVANEPGVMVVRKQNEGHGPTILGGYRRACVESEWVFQVDSDDEIRASEFPALWARREGQDAVLGVREGRGQSLGRRLLSGGSRGLVRLTCGSGIPDVNVPFRLMRSAVLSPLLEMIPSDMFAPNVAISGLLLKHKRRIATVTVQNHDRRTGSSSLVSWRLLGIALKSFLQVGQVLVWERKRP